MAHVYAGGQWRPEVLSDVGDVVGANLMREPYSMKSEVGPGCPYSGILLSYNILYDVAVQGRTILTDVLLRYTLHP